jgi:hypothetical protein
MPNQAYHITVLRLSVAEARDAVVRALEDTTVIMQRRTGGLSILVARRLRRFSLFDHMRV